MSESAPLVDLRSDHWKIIRDLLQVHVPDRKVLAFGSRATWTAKEYSDLDLAVLGDEPLAHEVFAALSEGFRESDLPFKVDLVDWSQLDEKLRRAIQRDGVGLQVPPSAGQAASSTCIRSLPLRDLVDLTLSSVDKKSKKHERRVHLCNYMDVYSNAFIQSRLDFMSATATEREIDRCEIRVNDVLLTKDSEAYDDIGVPALVKERIDNLLCGYHLAILRPDPTVLDGTYLYYALQIPTVQHQFHAYANGVTRFSLRKNDILRTEVPMHEISVQRAIARILSTLDDKIELNQRMNETLEAMAKTIFKDWFVDFGPVRAKLEGRESYLPSELWDLFPSTLVDTYKGSVPLTWQTKHLGECFNITMGQSPPGSSYNDTGDGLPFFQGKTDFGFRYPTNRRFCSAPSRIARTNDTLVSVRAPVGDTNMSWEKCCIGRGIASLKHVSKSVSYTYYAIRAMHRNIAAFEDNGTVFGAITRKQLETLDVLDPSANAVQAFESIAGPIDQHIRINVAQIRSLTQVRDSLIPKLVSGEVRVRDAETIVGQVL